MTLTLAYDSTRGKATRTHGFTPGVPSQDVSRYQATSGRESIVSREAGRPWRWVALVAVFAALIFGGQFAPFAGQVACGVVVGGIAGVVLARVCR